MTLAAALRSYVAAHPACTSAEVASALGIDHKQARGRLNNLARFGIVRPVGESPRTYAQGRPVIRVCGLSVTDARQRKAERDRQWWANNKARQAPAIKAANSSEYEQLGGRIERLPAAWEIHA